MVSLIEILQEHYKDLSTEVMSAYGNGYRNKNRKKNQAKEKVLMKLSLMRLSSRLVLDICGYW